MKTNVLTILSFIGFFTICSCQKEDIINVETANNPSPVSTRVIPTPDFDWENADWMPTPTGQTRIPAPWIGQGSISSTYGIDVVNDRKSSNGWELVYNTFDPNATTLVNPYFILYNKYRGIMRIFLYLTTPFVSPSSYAVGSLSVISNHKTSMLNFMGNDLIDGTNRPTTFSQILPAPEDGSSPLASNKWYMMQYELAYDPNLTNIPYNEIQLNWSANYCNITAIDLGGDITGTIKSSIGSNSDITSKISTTGSKSATAVLGGIGSEFLKKNTIDEETGENKLGLPKTIFKSVLKGATQAISGGVGGAIGAAANLLSSIVFGGDTKTMSFDLNAEIKLTGNSSEKGSFPSSPTSFWTPGTYIPDEANGYIPLYNKPLGVINMLESPQYNVLLQIQNAIWNNRCYRFEKYDFQPEWRGYFSKYLTFNPAVKEIANIKKKQADLLIFVSDESQVSPEKDVVIEEIGSYGKVYVNPTIITLSRISNKYIPHNTPILAPFTIGIRFTIEIEPLNGSPTSVITKTFKLTPTYPSIEILDDIIYD